MNRYARPVPVIRDFTLGMLICGALAAAMKLSRPAEAARGRLRGAMVRPTALQSPGEAAGPTGPSPHRPSGADRAAPGTARPEHDSFVTMILVENQSFGTKA